MLCAWTGHPVIFSNAFRDELLAHAEPEGCQGILGAHRDHVVHVESEMDCYFTDIDTREDLDRLIRMK